AIHLLPSGAWRIYSNIAHYAWVACGACNHFLKRKATGKNEPAAEPQHTPEANKTRLLRTLIAPTRHGEFGNLITEAYYFSRFRWTRLFRATGWTIEDYASNRLFYTGYSVLDSKLSIGARRLLSYFLGSACHVFILKKDPAAHAAAPVADAADLSVSTRLLRSLVPVFGIASQIGDLLEFWNFVTL